MASTYTGTHVNVSLPDLLQTLPQVTIPGDGDPLNAASVNAALQKLTDYAAYILESAGISVLHFMGQPGNSASTTYFAWVAGWNVTAMGTSAEPAGGFIHAPFNGRLVGISYNGMNLTGGNCIIQTRINGVASGPSVTAVPATTFGSVLNVSSATFVAGQKIGLQCANQVGVSVNTMTVFSVYMSLL